MELLPRGRGRRCMGCVQVQVQQLLRVLWALLTQEAGGPGAWALVLAAAAGGAQGSKGAR